MILQSAREGAGNTDTMIDSALAGHFIQSLETVLRFEELGMPAGVGVDDQGYTIEPLFLESPSFSMTLLTVRLLQFTR